MGEGVFTSYLVNKVDPRWRAPRAQCCLCGCFFLQSIGSMLKTATGYTFLPPVFGKPSYEESLNYVIESLNITDITAETGNNLFYCYCLLVYCLLLILSIKYVYYIVHICITFKNKYSRNIPNTAWLALNPLTRGGLPP